MSAEARLRWRARRGTRELDAMLGWWMDARYAHADTVQRTHFDELLDSSDPDLWDWLTGHLICNDPRFAPLIDEIRAHHCI